MTVLPLLPPCTDNEPGKSSGWVNPRFNPVKGTVADVMVIGPHGLTPSHPRPLRQSSSKQMAH